MVPVYVSRVKLVPVRRACAFPVPPNEASDGEKVLVRRCSRSSFSSTGRSGAPYRSTGRLCSAGADTTQPETRSLIALAVCALVTEKLGQRRRHILRLIRLVIDGAGWSRPSIMQSGHAAVL